MAIIGGMKKFIAAVFLFAVGIVVTAIWFSPLAAFAQPNLYDDNVPIAAVQGLCYPADSVCRVDFCGGERDLFRALKAISASEIKRVEFDGAIYVYAYSPRVAVKAQKTDGAEYNVMAVYSKGRVVIGTPVISGCY